MTFSAYVPTDRLHALAAGRDLPDRACGAALFADLAGFTRLTETLARELGPQLGAEELTRQLNSLYGVLVAAVDRFGGSVVSFSGDAVTCWFDELEPQGAGPARSSAALRAIACALVMQAGVQALPPVVTPGGDRVPLGVKVAVIQGCVRRFSVGDPTLGRVDVLAGATLDLLSVVEHMAASGEVLLDGATAGALAEQIVVGEWRVYSATATEVAVLEGLGVEVAPAPWPTLARPVDDELTRPWMLPAVAERLRGGSGALLAELRRAVALFLSFGGIDYDGDEDAPLLLDAFLRRLQALATAYGGSLLQLTIGDKGSYLYLAFGAPTAHHDAAANAVAAAREIVAMAPQLGFITQVRVGVAQGQMYSGAYGGVTRRTYGVLGDSTNVAARLMGICPPGEVRCDESVYRAARRHWMFAELPAVQVKGKTEPIRVFSPTAPIRARPAPPAASAPIGRQAELARLTAAIEELDRGAGGVVAIVGEAGVGKSLLADTFAQIALTRGLRVLRGAARSIEQQTPYRAWRELGEALFGLGTVEGHEARRARVSQTVAEAVPQLAQRTPLLNDVLHLGFPDTPLTGALDARLRQESLLALLVTLLGAELRRAPVVLLIEDVQWLDALSWQMTLGVARALLGEGAALLVVVVHRPLGNREPAANHAAALAALPQSTTLALGGLPEQAIAELAAQRLGLAPGALPEGVAALLRERAAGNPFFAEELIDNLIDRELITVAMELNGAPTCTVSPELSPGRAPLPETIEGLVLARIDRLPAEQQLLLKVAAVIGRSFGEAPLRATLRHYAAIEHNALVQYLEGLEREDLTLLETLEPELTYAFKHIITHNVAYETMLFGQRAEIHRAVALWYEGAFAGRLDPYYPLLAHHYQLAGDRAGEARYAGLAGQQAAALFANEDAIGYLSRALELTPQEDEAGRFELLREREQILNILGRRDEQALDLRALEVLAERLDDNLRRAMVALRRAAFAERVSDYEAGVLAAMRATLLAAVEGDAAIEADGHRYWGSLLHKQAKYDEARERLLRALELTADMPPSQTRANTLHLLGAVKVSQGNETGAGELFAQALELYRQLSDRRGEATELISLGMVASFSGDYRRARALSQESLELYRQVGDRQGEAYALGNIGDDCVALGDYGAAMACQEQALALFRATGSWEGEGWALHNLGEVWLTLGGYEQAQALYTQALAIFQAIESAEDECNARRQLALIEHLQGGHTATVAQASEAMRIAATIGYARGRSYALTVLGHGLLGLGKLDAAEAAYGEARGLREGQGERVLVLESAAGLARVALARGDTAGAVALVEPILAHLAAADLGGADEPARVELTCYEALRAAGDERSPRVLVAAARRVRERAALIADAKLRRSFLTAVAAHKALLEAAAEEDRSRR